MKSLTFWYEVGQADGLVAATPAELDAALTTIANHRGPEWAAVAEITFTEDWETGPLLYAGFYQVAGIIWYSGHGEGKAFVSRDPTTANTDPMYYMYCENEFEVPKNAHLPGPLIREAVHEFAQTGERPTCLLWQEWQPL
ncbi:Imm1 family immunity protein [Actinokineospora sp. G85]|uniref:Imm1 family immunity protein n=1 Tax=Actinokineospora sp. G85 TaxID=3406626 RepID=UPI003C790996